MPLQELFDLLSKSLKEIEDELVPSVCMVKMQQGILANAASWLPT